MGIDVLAMYSLMPAQNMEQTRHVLAFFAMAINELLSVLCVKLDIREGFE